jgi:hypothetical protein
MRNLHRHKTKRDRVRMYIFFTLSMLSIATFYWLLLNSDRPQPYLLLGNVIFMGITTICTIAKSFYFGPAYDSCSMRQVWLIPTISFSKPGNSNLLHIVWLRWEIYTMF